MRTSPSPTCDAVTIVVFHVVAHSLHIVQTLASPALHSSSMHLYVYFLCRSRYSPLMIHVLHSLFSSLISICEQRLKYWVAKCKIQHFDNSIHNQRYTMLYIHSHWIPTLFVVKTTLVHQLPTLHAMCAFTLYQDGIVSYLQCSWIVQEHFESGISFITCTNNIWQAIFALLKNCYAWTIAVFTTNPSIIKTSHYFSIKFELISRIKIKYSRK